MKKIILSAASLAVAAVASVSVAPTTSEAIPAFARQTGSACLACHFQSFPTLSAYGRAFKMGGMVDSARDLVEDDGLSLPATLNWTVMVRPNWTSTDNAGTKTDEFVFADQVFMIGGRGGEHTGVFLEVGGGAYANAQMINSWDMGDLKAGVTVFQAGFGEDAGMQVMSVWGQHGGLLGGKGLTINNSMGAAATSTGVTAWAGNSTWVAQLGLVQADIPEATAVTSFGYAPVIRGNYFLEAGDFEVGIGAIIATGTVGTTTSTDNAGAVVGERDQKRTGVDIQALGEMGDLQVGIFADYATAPAGSATTANVYNSSTTDDRTGFSLRTTIKPTHNLIFMVGVGEDKTGGTKTAKTAFGVEWEAYQNMAVNFTYNDDVTSAPATADVSVKTTAFELELLI